MVLWGVLYNYLLDVEHQKIDKISHKHNYDSMKYRFGIVSQYFKYRKFTRQECDKLLTIEKNKGLSSSSLNNILKTIKAITRYYHYHKEGNKEVLEDICMIPYFTKHRVRTIDVLTPQEIKNILMVHVNYLRDQRETTRKYRVAIYLLSLGLRISEVCNLKYDDFKGDHIIVTERKTESAERKVFIPPHVSSCISDLPRLSSGYLLGNSRGKINRKTIADDLSHRTKLVGIKKRVTPHVLRHSFIMNSLDAGVPLQNVCNHVGHKNLNQMVDYLHQSLKHSKEAVELNPLFSTRGKDRLREEVMMKLSRISDEKKLRAISYMI